MRDALFAKKLKPGDFLGTEKDLAARFGVSRIVARDALRTLQALGIADIKMGKGGGARVVARQSAPVRRGARRAARPHRRQRGRNHGRAARDRDARRRACRRARDARPITPSSGACSPRREAIIDDTPAYTRSCRDFHLAVAEASHNRVLVTQLISLQHVSWPSENRTLTPQVARRVLDVHRELAVLIEMRDAAGARRLMDDHVKMIRARRVAEHASDETDHCC